MLDSRAWRAARPARTSAREEAFRIEGPGAESELILLLLLLVLLSLLRGWPGVGGGCGWAEDSPLGKLLADIGTRVLGSA